MSNQCLWAWAHGSVVPLVMFLVLVNILKKFICLLGLRSVIRCKALWLTGMTFNWKPLQNVQLRSEIRGFKHWSKKSSICKIRGVPRQKEIWQMCHFLYDKRMSAFALVILFVFWILPVLHIRGENLEAIFGICTPGLAKVDRGGSTRMIIMVNFDADVNTKN